MGAPIFRQEIGPTKRRSPGQTAVLTSSTGNAWSSGDAGLAANLMFESPSRNTLVERTG
jgi:hypothetical protein